MLLAYHLADLNAFQQIAARTIVEPNHYLSNISERLHEIMELLRVARSDLALDADVADIDVSDFGEMGMPLSCLQPPC